MTAVLCTAKTVLYGDFSANVVATASMTVKYSNFILRASFTPVIVEWIFYQLDRFSTMSRSHNRLGWVKTINEGFYGSEDDIRNAGVQTMLDHVIVQLFKNEHRRFIYGMSLFLKTMNMQEGVLKLINEGRLEFVGGTGASNCEATVPCPLLARALVNAQNIVKMPLHELTSFKMLKSSISHEGVFYTGLNGREMMKRVRKERDFFRSNDTEGVSSNYYLINGRLVLEGDRARLVLLNDRTQGGSSTEEGALE
uniref:Uncharacterized protein n=1 Tax=Glossina austeni TaxID=7395 RepID=A0A1A9VX99_GLOAU